MRHDTNLHTNARIVTANELAQVIAPPVRTPVLAEHTDFEMPGWIWATMLGGYVTFFAGISAATAGDGRAVFAIVISILYTAMFFGTARVLSKVDGRRVGAFDRAGGRLNTWTGPMDARAVAGQMLAVPLLLGFFGICIAIIAAAVR